MHALEIVFVLATAALLVSLNTRWATRRTSAILFGIGLTAAVAAFALGQARLQMAPAALLFVVLFLVLLLRRGHSHFAVRTVGVICALLLVGISVVLALALPIVTLPTPDGPHTVGVTSFTLVDGSRDETRFGAPERSREIYVQAWYPGTIPEATSPRRRLLWEALLGGQLGRIETHSYGDIPVSPAENSYPTILFSPSLGGIAEQNTLLMEHLASHGYIVLGVTHPYFGFVTTYADGTGVPASNLVLDASSQQGAVDLDAISARAERAATPIERAEIRLEYFEQGTMLNEFMEIWVDDLRLLLDAVTAANEPAAPAMIASRVARGRIGMLGMSYGGGAVTEVCKVDDRCRAALNLDGGLWGSRVRQPLEVPYLLLASPGNEPLFEYLRLTSEAPYYALTVEGVMHTNFMDVSLFAPVLRWLGVTGSIEGERIIAIMNVVSRRFFDAYLRGAAKPSFPSAEFPDVSVETNDLAERTAERSQSIP